MTPDTVAIFGTQSPPVEAVAFAIGPVTLTLAGGDVCNLRLHGVEVLRRLSYPVRDANWGTLLTCATREDQTTLPTSLNVARWFEAVDRSFRGEFVLTVRLEGDAVLVAADLTITPTHTMRVNRAGFTLLHPLRGVTGQPLHVTHSSGAREITAFPNLISPGQPVFDITGLSHVVDGVKVDIAMTGDVFEMEDQRNWSDASYKTYCRPLGLPWPYELTPETPVRQSIAMTLQGRSLLADESLMTRNGRMPHIAVACVVGAALHLMPGMEHAEHQLRVRSDATAEELQPYAGANVTLEIQQLGAVDFTHLAAVCARVGLQPRRVIAVPEAYLNSHQPSGPWPLPTPSDLITPLREAFPRAEIGGGVLTNFTEFNRCPPDPSRIDFATFGSTAIVHAADDRSVLETLEALPDITSSARALSGDKPLRLGLISIGMRSNPYGAFVMPNSARIRLPMAMVDPRQVGLFAAAWAVGVLAGCLDVESLALAMPDGPLGATDPAGGVVYPIYHVMRAAEALAGQPVRVSLGPERLLRLICEGSGVFGIIANLGSETMEVTDPFPKLVLSPASFCAAGADPDWLFTPGETGPALLVPYAIAFIKRSEE